MKPKKLKKKKVISIIKKSCDVTGVLYEHGSYCVIGALLHKAGVSNRELIDMEQSVEDMELETKQLLYQVYGLDCDLAGRLMGINDGNRETEQRRLRLIEAVNAAE